MKKNPDALPSGVPADFFTQEDAQEAMNALQQIADKVEDNLKNQS
ncbi:MAG: hypothetical protein ACOCWQ_03240 [Nanoarchaeota archaeon]